MSPSTHTFSAVRPALIALACAYFFIGATSLGVIGLVPEMAAGLGISKAAAATMVTSFAMVYAVAAPGLQAMLGDVSRRTLLAGGVSLMALSCWLCALAPDYWTATAARVGMAIGAAMTGPTASAAAASLVSPEDRPRALAAVFTGLTVSTVLGVPLVSFLGQTFGWRVAWGVLGLAAAGVVPFVLMLIDRENRGQRATLSAFATVLRDRALALSVATTAAQLLAQFVTYGLLAVWLLDAAGYPSGAIPPLLLVLGIGGIAGNALSPVIAARLGPERAIQAGLTVMIAMLFLMALSDASSWILPVFIFIWSVAGLMVMAPLQTRLVRLAPGQASLSLALNASAIYVGMSLGSALGTVVFEAGGLPFLPLVSAVLAIGALFVFRAGLVR